MVIHPSSNGTVDTEWKILIIDDDEEDFLIARDMLKEVRGGGLNIHWAKTYAAGREELTANDYHAVLVDYDLGRHTGIELIREATARGNAAPLILFTGRGSDAVDEEAMEAGAAMYLTKGEVNPLQLERAIRYAINQNIRARKQAELDVREREAQIEAIANDLRATLDAVPAFMFITHDPQAREMTGNAPVIELMRMKPGDNLSKTGPEPEKLRHFKAMRDGVELTNEELPVQKVATSGVPLRDFEFDLVFEDGEVIHLLGNVSPLLDEKGNPAGAVSAFIDITAMKEFQHRLEESERVRREANERFRVTLAFAPISVYTTDRDLRLTWMHDFHPGFDPQAVLGLRLDQMLPGEYGEALIKIQQAVIDTGQGQHGEIETRSNGERFVYTYYIDPIRDEAGDVAGLACAGYEITELKLAEEARAESEQKYRLLFENSPEAIFLTIPDGTIEAANPAACAMFGWTEAEICRLGRGGLIDMSDPKIPSVLEERQRTGRVRGREITGIRSSGERFPAEHDSVILPGNPQRAFVMMRDITERKRAEQALQASENRLRRLVEGNIIGTNIRDAAGQIKDANTTFSNMIGYACDELQSGGLTMRDLTPHEFWAADQQAVTETLANGACQPYEKAYFHKDGHTIPCLVGYTRLDESSDDLIGFVLDMTETARARAKLEEYAEKLKKSNQELEQFAFVASHDLQEPLRKIVLFGNQLQIETKGTLDDQSLDYLNRMRSAAERMQAMINGLLELSRVNRQGGDFQPININQVIAEAVSDLEAQIRLTNGQIVISQLPAIIADEMQIRRLFQNLIGNAIKFHQPDVPPVVQISGSIHSRTPAVAEIVVKDNGIGFVQEQAERIFQPFQRLHGRSEYEGTGLGLAICQKIVERHHGSITVESAPGQGTTFTVRLPQSIP